jgi:hypothetical protein
MWFRRHTEHGQFREVVLEAQRLLTGGVCEPDQLRELHPPAWALISVLAHSSRARLLRISDAALTDHPGSWAATLGSLARELLTATSGRQELIEVQRLTLVPMELRLLAGATRAPATPSRLRNLVLGALDEHPMRPDWKE